MIERKIRIAQVFWGIFLTIFSVVVFSLLGFYTFVSIDPEQKSLGAVIFVSFFWGCFYFLGISLLFILINKIMNYINGCNSEYEEDSFIDWILKLPIMLNESAKRKQTRKAEEEARMKKQKEEEMAEVDRILREEGLIL